MGRKPGELLPSFNEDELLAMLAAAGRERAYEKYLMRVELRGRLDRARREIDRAAHRLDRVTSDVRGAAEFATSEAWDAEAMTEGHMQELHGGETAASRQARVAAVAAEAVKELSREAQRASEKLAASTDRREDEP